MQCFLSVIEKCQIDSAEQPKHEAFLTEKPSLVATAESIAGTPQMKNMFHFHQATTDTRCSYLICQITAAFSINE